MLIKVMMFLVFFFGIVIVVVFVVVQVFVNDVVCIDMEIWMCVCMICVWIFK